MDLCFLHMFIIFPVLGDFSIPITMPKLCWTVILSSTCPNVDTFRVRLWTLWMSPFFFPFGSIWQEQKKGRKFVKVVYVVLESQYQSAMTTAIRQINKTPGPVCMECVGYLLEDCGRFFMNVTYQSQNIRYWIYKDDMIVMYTVMPTPDEWPPSTPLEGQQDMQHWKSHFFDPTHWKACPQGFINRGEAGVYY